MRTLVKTQCGTPTNSRFFFDDFFRKDFFQETNNAITKTTPSINVRETEKDFILDVAAPGLQKEDFKVEVENDILTISSEKTAVAEENKGSKLVRKEFSFTSFKRSFVIDENHVDSENIIAKYENGILEITLPKKLEREEKKRAKSITIF